MFSLAPLGDLTRFRRSNIKSEVYVVTEDVCIKSHGVLLLLAARSVKIKEMLEESENIPALEFSHDLTGLEDCLDLIYGGSIIISEDNYKTIPYFSAHCISDHHTSKLKPNPNSNPNPNYHPNPDNSPDHDCSHF